MVLNLLKHHYFSHNFSQIILCIPRMSINQMDILHTFVAMKIAGFEYLNVKSLKMKENTAWKY